jgi:hypothetical protein
LLCRMANRLWYKQHVYPYDRGMGEVDSLRRSLSSYVRAGFGCPDGSMWCTKQEWAKLEWASSILLAKFPLHQTLLEFSTPQCSKAIEIRKHLLSKSGHLSSFLSKWQASSSTRKPRVICSLDLAIS